MELFFLILLIVLMAGALGSGYPVAFALPGASIITLVLAGVSGYLVTGDQGAYFSQGDAWTWLSSGNANLRGTYWVPERDTLIAIPLFIFMGIMLQRSKIAEDLLLTMANLFGPVRGGLGVSVVFVGALLAATTGIVGATVVAMGLISLPAMLRNNYSQSLATGTIAASGTLGQIIPPSIVLIILADQLASAADQGSSIRKALHKETTGELSMPSTFDVTSTSAGEMFLGAFIPGLVLVCLYIIYILVFAFLKPSAAPSVPYKGKYDRAFANKVFLALVPPLLLIFIVLGSIMSGIATVNQAGAIGAAGALIMAGYRLTEGQKGCYHPAILCLASLLAVGLILSNFDTNIKGIETGRDQLGVALAVIATIGLLASLIWSGYRALKIEDTLNGVMMETAKATALVFIILLGAAILTAAFRAFGGEHLVKEFLDGLAGGFWSKFIIVMAVIFILGFFLDFIEIAVVVVPIVAPILLMDPSANVTAVWLGVMIGLNIQTSFLTPPFGFALFYLRGVAPAIVKTIQIYKGVIAFICLQLVALFIVAVFPPLVNYLPNRVSLTSETAPPPINPRLQYCIEEITFAALTRNSDQLRSAITTASKLDYSYVPTKLKNSMEGSFINALSVFDLRDEVSTRSVAVDAKSDAYRPLHREVRSIEKRIRRNDIAIKALGIQINRMDPADTETKGELLAEVEERKRDRSYLVTTIPENWKVENTKFVTLQKAYDEARKNYRSAMDKGYIPVQVLMGILDGTKTLSGLREQIAQLENSISTLGPKEAAAKVSAVSKLVGKINGTKAIKSGLTKVRRAVKSKKSKPGKAQKALLKTLKVFDKDMLWRERGVKELLPSIKTYEGTIRNTIGLRQLTKLPAEQALEVASCSANHRDISLSF